MISCGFCGSDFYIIKSRIPLYSTHYCSASCTARARWEGKRKYPRVIGTCVNCRSDIMAKGGAYDKPGRKFCSHRCQTIYKNKTTPKTSAQMEHSRWLGSTAKGRRRSIEQRRQMSERFRGAKSHFWRGGLTEANRKDRNRIEIWVQAVFRRDDYTCQRCGIRGAYLEAHHDLPFARYPALRFELLNGVTLCKPCHDRTKIGSIELARVWF